MKIFNINLIYHIEGVITTKYSCFLCNNIEIAYWCDARVRWIKCENYCDMYKNLFINLYKNINFYE